jgi:putative ABC transport system permease protein
MRDLRYSFRTLIASPGFTIAAILCLALGIGATSAIFTVVNAILLRPLPYREPGKLVRVYTEFPQFPNGGLRKFWTSPPEFLELRRDSKSWDALDAFTTGGGVNLAGIENPIRVTSSSVTGGMFDLLGVSPAMGRTINMKDDENGAPLVAVIGHGLWQRAFGSDRGILNRTVQVNGRNAQIIGVMGSDFRFPPGELDPPEIWLPLQLNPANPGGRGSHFLYLLGRLKPGLTVAHARTEFTQYEQHLREIHGGQGHWFDSYFHPLVAYPMHDEVVGNVKTALWMLLGAVGFVLLIACVNVANLLLARAEARQREIAIRKALGAGTAQLIRQFMTEGVLLSFAGAVFGMLFAWGGLRLIVAAGSASIPRASEVRIDMMVLLVTLGVSVLTGIFFGLAPIIQLAAGNLHDALKAAGGRTSGSIGAQHFRRVLVVTELALALVLLIGTGLMIRAFWKLQEVNTGFRADRVLTLRIALPAAVYGDVQSVLRFWSSALERVRALPAVESAALATGLPPQRRIDANDTQIEGWNSVPGGPGHNIDFWQIVSPDYFSAMGLRLMEGRFLDQRDTTGANATVVINETIARTYYGNESPIGRRIRPAMRDPWCTIVGVVADVKNAGLDKPAGTEIFLPYQQAGTNFGRPNAAYMIIRAKTDPERLVSAVRNEIRAIDPALPLSQVRTMDEVLAGARARPRFLATLLSLFAGVALVLAAVGLYGVIAYSVTRRTTEFGIRMAMGASREHVLRMVLRQGLILGVIGTVIGGAGAYGLTRLIRGLLFGVSAVDPPTFIVMALALIGVTLLACWVPARRATKVDPMIALRYE